MTTNNKQAGKAAQDGEQKKQGRKAIDWEAVEKAYRAGLLSIREIAKAHDISDKAVRNKAKEHGWERDLSAKVAEKVRNDLVRAESAPAEHITERQIVEHAAATVVQVVRSHRKAISQGQQLVELLTKQLIDVAGRRDEFEQAIELECADDESPKRRTLLMKAVSLGTHAGIAVNLANATKTWVGLERQAFSIKDDSTPDDSMTPADKSELAPDEAYKRMLGQ